MKKSRTRNLLSEAFDDAYCEAFQLGEEMREAFDATPEQFKDNSGKEREVAADILEAMLQPSVPDSIALEEIEWIEMRKGKDGKLFRPARRDNILRCLRAGLMRASMASDDSRAMTLFVSDTKIDIQNLERIRFPGMSGR